MGSVEIALLVSGTYKFCTLIVGSALAYMGYRLFVTGVFEKAGDLKTTWGEKGLVLKQAAPGTYFALFGTVVIAVGLWRGMDIQIKEAQPKPPSGEGTVVSRSAAKGTASGQDTTQAAGSSKMNQPTKSDETGLIQELRILTNPP